MSEPIWLDSVRPGWLVRRDADEAGYLHAVRHDGKVCEARERDTLIARMAAADVVRSGARPKQHPDDKRRVLREEHRGRSAARRVLCHDCAKLFTLEALPKGCLIGGDSRTVDGPCAGA